MFIIFSNINTTSTQQSIKIMEKKIIVSRKIRHSIPSSSSSSLSFSVLLLLSFFQQHKNITTSTQQSSKQHNITSTTTHNRGGATTRRPRALYCAQSLCLDQPNSPWIHLKKLGKLNIFTSTRSRKAKTLTRFPLLSRLCSSAALSVFLLLLLLQSLLLFGS